jgi:8-oxo-dGTP pyrophosphatase MutT (NUDIX family)
MTRGHATVRLLSCGVLVTDGERLLLGHATGSPRWDIPKGLLDPGETPVGAALRELREETGLIADPAALQDLGVFRYRPGKELALFLWRHAELPDPASLHCSSRFRSARGAMLPEFDRFAVLPWDVALSRVGKAMAGVLGGLAATVRQAATASRPPSAP